nr:hypothetical protein [Pandoravirus massiliensis]
MQARKGRQMVALFSLPLSRFLAVLPSPFWRCLFVVVGVLLVAWVRQSQTAAKGDCSRVDRLSRALPFFPLVRACEKKRVYPVRGGGARVASDSFFFLCFGGAGAPCLGGARLCVPMRVRGWEHTRETRKAPPTRAKVRRHRCAGERKGRKFLIFPSFFLFCLAGKHGAGGTEKETKKESTPEAIHKAHRRFARTFSPPFSALVFICLVA